jgi:hypothetical protein
MVIHSHIQPTVSDDELVHLQYLDNFKRSQVFKKVQLNRKHYDLKLSDKFEGGSFFSNIFIKH